MFLIFVFVGNCLQQALRKIGKENIVHNCVFNIEWVTDAAEKELARSRLTNQNLQADGNPISGRRVRVDSQLRFFFSELFLFFNSWTKVSKVTKNLNVVDTENQVS